MSFKRLLGLIVFIGVVIFLFMGVYKHTKGYTDSDINIRYNNSLNIGKDLCTERGLIYAGIELRDTHNIYVICINKIPFMIQKLKVK